MLHRSAEPDDTVSVRVLHFAMIVGMLAVLVHAVNRDLLTVTPANIRVKRPEPTVPVSFSTGGYERIDWSTLRALKTGQAAVSRQLQLLHGRNVAIPGYVVPLEDNAGFAGEFLVVPYFGACVHSPPPPPNQMLLVKLTGGREIKPPVNAIWIHGVLKIESRESPYGQVAYSMDGSHIEPFTEK